MEKIKEPSVADMFYTADSEELKNQINEFLHKNGNSYNYQTRAVIVPHAGLIYSGQLAFEGINQLDKNIKNIFIFAPAHRVAFAGLALSGFDEWKTPLGNISVNQEINRELSEKFGLKIFDDGYANEHSVEIQIPIIQTVFDDVKIIPILVGNANPQQITDVINEYYNRKDCGFIISSDMSHFLTDDGAKRLDEETAEMIETGNFQNFRYEQACGAVGICGLGEFANKNRYSLIRINMYNSSVVSGDKSSVVGYGSWFLYEGNKNKFIKDNYSDYLLTLCKDIILSRYTNDRLCTAHAPVFNEKGACFVTLKKYGNLRGCIGSIVAHQPLINDIVDNAQSAAFRDPRFEPVTEEEVGDLTIDISLLSNPEPMSFKDEQDLLDQIVPYKDGIIIKDGWHQAVYLPSVWEDLPEKELFLKNLKIKAGMSPDHFSKNFQAFRFGATVIEH